MRLRNFGFLAFPSLLLALSSCLGDDISKNDYAEWRQLNNSYLEEAEAATLNGNKLFEKIVPDWDKSIFTLMQWHNDRRQTIHRLSPLDNSTVDVVYMLTNVEGDTIDSSFALTENGDSIYRCRPCDMITGFQLALTNMHIGDSVTTVIPYTAAYGVTGYGSIPPYSTLVFNIKLVDIPAFEIPSKSE